MDFDVASLLLAPLILLPDLLLLGRGEVVLDVEDPADLLGGPALDHVGHSFTGDVHETLDVQVVGRQDELKEGALVDTEEVCVPGGDVVRPLLLVLLLLCRDGIILVVGGPGNDLNTNDNE